MENKNQWRIFDPATEKKENKNAQQEQIHNILFNREIGWQEIIYDLINTEQLDPWNIDIMTLTDKYLEKIKEIEEADFFISSKVLLAATLLLRIKSEILLNKYIKSIDEILFGKKEIKKTIIERIELEEEIPELIPKSPIPRFRKVTIKELIESLNKAINTENKRIKKELIKSNALMDGYSLISKRRFNIKDKIREIYMKLLSHLKKDENKKISLTEFVGEKKEEKIISFFPLLHLETQKKIWLEQEAHFEEIYIWLKEVYLKHNSNPLEDLKKELEEQIKKFDEKQKKRLSKVNRDFENPLGNI